MSSLNTVSLEKAGMMFFGKVFRYFDLEDY